MTKVIVENATGKVITRIELEPDEHGTFDHWACPEGCVIMDDGIDAEVGAIWDGQQFTGLIKPEVDSVREAAMERLEVLHNQLQISEVLTMDEILEMLRLERIRWE